MSMYKTIFVTEEESAGQPVFSVNGEVQLTGESAFASLNEAVAAVTDGKAIAVVHKVSSGKYESFVVEGTEFTAVSAIAVDFNGGEVVIDGEKVTVADSGIGAEAQATVLADLNAKNAAHGKVFVAANEVTAGLPTIYVGMGESGFVAGTSAAVVTGPDTDTMIGILDSQINTSTSGWLDDFLGGLDDLINGGKDGGTIYVNSDYTTDGKTKFKTYADALAFVSGKDASTKYEIVIEKVAVTDKYVANQSLINDYEEILDDRTGVATVINSGARMDIATGKADITNDITVKAGGTLAAYRDSDVREIHIKNGAALVAGEANGARATVNLMYTTTRGYDVLTTAGDNWLAGSSKIEMVNTDFTCRDLSLKDGAGTFKNSTLVIQGALGAEAKLTLENSTATVWGDNGHSTEYFKDFNNLANVKMTNSTLNIGVENDNITPDKVVLGSVEMSNSFINVEKTAQVFVNGSVTLTGTSELNVGALDIASGKTLKIDSTATITADSLNVAGNIVINLVNGFTGGMIIDINGSGLTQEAWNKLIADNKITITGTGKDDFGLTIQEGDIYVMKGVGIKGGNLDLTENKAETFTGTIGNANDDLTITSTGTATSETATINADVKAKDVTLTNSKDLNVAGSVNASGDMTITNAAGATISGADDTNGAKLTAAGTINMTNDGHADVDMDATNINIKNNSVNTITGEITATEKVEISADKVTVDGVEKSGQGKVEDATITAKNVVVSDQIVEDTTVNGTTRFLGDSVVEDVTVNGKIYAGTMADDDETDFSGVQSSTLAVNGDLKANTLWIGAQYADGKTDGKTASVTVAEGASITTGGANSGLVIRESGELTTKGDVTIGHDQQVVIQGKVTVDGENASFVTQSSGVGIYKENAEFVVTNGASATFGEYNDTNIYIGKDSDNGGGKLTVEAGSSITINEKLNIKKSGQLTVSGSTFTAEEVANAGTFTVSGKSSLNIDKVTGNDIAVAGAATLTNSAINGVSLNVAYENSAADSSLTLLGNNTISSLWVGGTGSLQVGEAGDDKQRNTADVSLGDFYVRPGGAEINVDNASLKVTKYGNWKGSLTANNAYIGAHNDIYVYDNNNAGLLTWELNNSELNIKSGYDVSIGGKDGIAPNGNATLILNNSSITGGSKLNVAGAGDVSDDGVFQFVSNGSSMVLNNSTVDLGILNVGQGATITVNNSTMTVGTINNAGTIDITVSADFLAGMTDDRAIISQTNANAAALDITVNIAGKDYALGDYITTIGDKDYYLTKGDGNDIVLDVRKDKIYVNSDGSGDFTNFADARAYATANAPTATIVVQETNGINVVEGGIRNLPDMNIVIEDGAKLGTGYNSMKLTQDVTIKAGGFFGNLRNDTYGNLQIEGSNMVVGEADATEKAELDLYKGNKYSSGHTGGQSLIVKENSSFTANNATIEFSDFTANGAASFTDTEATVQGTVALGWDRTDSDGNFFTAANATMTNTTMSVVGNGALKGDGYGQPVNSFDKLTMTNSSITVDDLKEGSAAADVTIGNVAMTGSSFTAEAGTDVTVTGNVNITDSSLTVGSLAMGENGKLNLTLSHEKLLATGTTAYYLINQTETSAAALDVKVNYNGKEYAVGDTLYSANGVDYKLVAGDNNDIAIQATAEEFVVDAAYTTATAGYGISKFNSFTAALKAASESQTVKEIKLASSINGEVMPSDVEFIVNNDIAITSDTPVSVNLKNVGTSYDIVLNSTNGNTITFGKNVSIALDDRVIWAGYYGNNVNIEINGSVSGYQWWNGADTTVNAGGKLSTSGEAMIFRRGATLTVNGNAAQGAAAADREVQIDANYLNFLSGNLIATNSRIESGAVWIANNGSYTNESSVWINLDNTVLNSTGNLKLNSDATALMIVENGSTLNVTNFDGYGASEIGANGSLWVYDSTANLKDVNNAGDIDIADSTFVVNGTLNNTGMIGVAGDSTIKVNNLVGTMNVADATINDGSFIGGKKGSVDISGDEVNFDGNVTIDGAVNSNKSSDATTININEGAVVNINGKEYDKWEGGVNFGATDTLNVDGTLNVNKGDNFYLKATTNVAGELNVTDAGFQNTYGKLTVTGAMNITDTFDDGAYQNIKLAGNDNASTTGELDVNGGTLTIDAPSFAFGGGYKSSGWVDVTSADVTVQNGGKITSNAVVFRNGANSTMTLDNGTFEFTAAPDFGTVHVTLGTGIDNLGTINASNGSTLDFGDRAFTNAGTFTADDSTVNVGLINNNGTVKITGDGSFNVSKVTGSGTMTFGDAEGERSNISLGKVNGTGAEYTQTMINFYNSNLSLNENLIVTSTNGDAYSRIHSSNVDLNGKTLTINSKNFMLNTEHGLDSQGTTLSDGTYQINVNSLCFQRYNHVISENATVKIDGSSYGAHQINVYGSLTIEGQLYSTRNGKDVYTYANVGTTATAWPKSNYPESTLTVTGSNAKYIVENGHTFYVYHEREATGAGTLKVLDGAEFSFTGNGYGEFHNGNKVYVDAASSFTVTNYYGSENGYKGSFNSDKAGEMVVLGDVTVQNKLVTDSLIVNQGGVLSAGSITVDSLAIEIGGSLSLGGKSTAKSFTVTGVLQPENAEYTLVASGWDYLTDANGNKLQIIFDANNDNTISTDEYFTVGQLGANNIIFSVAADGSLYISKQNANITGIYIGKDVPASGTFIADDGAKYTVGTDAFASVEAAKGAITGDKAALVTSITLGSADLVSAAKAQFANLNDIRIEEGVKIEDATETTFNGNVNIDNDGHLNASMNIVDGGLTFTNTSDQTLLGSYTATNAIVGTNSGTMGGNYTSKEAGITIDNTFGNINDATTFTAGGVVDITGGDAGNVTVTANGLHLTDTNSFGLNASSGVLTATGSVSNNMWGVNGGASAIQLFGSANLSINGDASITAGIEAQLDDHTGTVTFNGNQTYTGDIAANKFVVAENGNVTVNSNQFDFNELNIAGTLSTDFTKHDAFTSQDTFTTAGSITGAGNLNTTHGGDWVINDSVERDFSGFTGTVSMADANASIVMGKGDVVVGSTVSSYFSDDATVVVNGDQSVVLAKDGVNTAIDFKGNGIINVGDYTGAFADQSEDFSQTLSGVNGEFTGTVNVSEGAVLKLESAIGANKIDLDYEATQSAIDTADELFDTQLILNAADVITEAEIHGDADDIIDVNADQTLNKLGALDNFSGTVDLNVNEITLEDVNDTAAKFTGLADSIIDANADLTLSAAAALNGFNGTVELEGDKLTLEGVNETSAKFTGTGTIDADANQTLKATGALDGFSGTVDLGANELTLEGVNYTDAKFSGTGIIDANADQILNAAGALDAFAGTIELENNELTLNDINDTNAKFTGTADSVIDANADQTLRAGGALNGFAGTVELEDNTLNLLYNNETSAKFTGTNTINAAGGNLTLNAKGALDDFSGTVNLAKNKLTLNAENDTDAKFIGSLRIEAKDDQTFNAEGALDGFRGTVKLEGNKLTLNGANETSAKFTGTNVIDANADQNFKAADALKDFSGTVELEGNSLTLGGANTTAAKFTGNTAADIKLNAETTLSATDAISGFDGTITVADAKVLTLLGANDTKATFVSDAASALIVQNENIFESNQALDNFKGNLSVESTLTLNGTNTTGATLWSTDDAVIVANVNQNFTGNVSNFSGTYDIASGAEVTLSGTIADTITAKGDTLTLSNATGKAVTVKSTADSNLANLNIGANNVYLTGGDAEDFTNVTGSGSIMDFGVDQSFGEITAAAINVKGSEDALTIDKLTANVNITIDAAQLDDKADVTVIGAFTGSITVNVADGDFVGDGYKLAANSAFTTASTIKLTVGTAAEVTLQVDERKVIGDKSYLLQLKDETLILTQMPGYSNYVAVNGGWSSKVPYQAVIDGTTERIIGYDAAASLDNAAEYIKGYDTGINDLAGTNLGDATMELVKGTYKLSDGKYLMTEANEVTQLDLVGREGQKVTINGTLNGSDGSKATSMLIENISTTGFVFAGGDLTINNSASVKTSGNAIAAGIAADAGTKTMVNDSTLTINGGNFTTSVLTGGSVAYGDGAVVNVEGDTSVVIDNQSGEKLTITSNIFGGSFAAQGTVNQTGDASITVKADQATVIRGDIYVSGAAGLGTLNMSGNSYITFTGDASMLTFTGTVSAIQSDKAEIATFDDFKGQFNGSLIGFDSITISGDTNLSLGRRQTETSNTGLVFNVTDATDTTDAAMFTVRDANAWEFSKSITINTEAFTTSGDYVIIDNYAGSFAGFTFTVNGTSYTDLASAGLTYNEATDQLVFKHESDAQIITGKVTADVTASAVKLTNAEVAKVNISGKDIVLENADSNVEAKISGGDYTGDITITADKDSSGGIIYGTAIDNSNGDINIDLDYVPAKVYGVAMGGSAKNVSVKIGGDVEKNIPIGAGEGNAVINGDAELIFKDGTKFATGNEIAGGVYGTGSDYGIVKGDASLEIGKNAVINAKTIVGGGCQINGDSSVVIKSGAKVNSSSIIGGTAWSGNVNGDSSVTINGADVTVYNASSPAKRAIYGGSYTAGSATLGNASVSITDSTVAGNIIGGNNDTASTSTTITITDSTVKNAEGAISTISAVGLTNTASTGTASVVINGNSLVATAINGQAELSTVSSTLDINGGAVTGDVSGFNSIELDVDAVISGSLTVSVEGTSLNVTGISSLTVDTYGVKAIANIDAALSNATIEGKDANSGAVQIAGAGTADLTDDVWAGIGKDSTGDTLVAWGTTEQFVNSTLTDLADDNFAIGDTYAIATSTETLIDENNKKNGSNGTLA